MIMIIYVFKISTKHFLNHFSLTEPIPFGSSESDLVLTGDDRTGERLSAPTGVFVGDGSSGIFSDVTVFGIFSTEEGVGGWGNFLWEDTSKQILDVVAYFRW